MTRLNPKKYLVNSALVGHAGKFSMLHSCMHCKFLKNIENTGILEIFQYCVFQQFASKKIFPRKKNPVIRICLLHWHSLTICLRHIVASVLTKFQAVPTKTYNISRVFWV